MSPAVSQVSRSTKTRLTILRRLLLLGAILVVAAIVLAQFPSLGRLAAGIFGVIAILIASDLMRGTGRFNLAQGLVALSVGIGAGLSNLTSGFVVQWYGYPAGFLYLAAIALVALLFFATFMPETSKPRDQGQQRPGSAPAKAVA